MKLLTLPWVFPLLLLLIAASLGCGSEAGPTEQPSSVASEAPTTEPTATLAVVPPTETPVEPTATSAATPTVAAPTEAPVEPTATAAPTERAATATPAPTVAPTDRGPKTSLPIRDFTQPSYSPEELTEVAELLAVLPPSAAAVIFVKPQSVLQRSEIASNIDDALSLLSKRTDRILSEEILVEAGIDRAAFVFTADYSGAAILSGDFSAAVDLLREAPEKSGDVSDFEPPSILNPYRGVEMFLFPYYDDLYLSVPDKATMLLAQSEQLLREIVDRYLDESALDESLIRLLDTTGPMDFLVLRHLDPEGQNPENPRIYAGGGWLDAEGSSSVFIFLEFANPEAAGKTMTEMKGWPLVQGYNSGENHPIQEILQREQTIFATGVAPNIDLGGWLLGN